MRFHVGPLEYFFFYFLGLFLFISIYLIVDFIFVIFTNASLTPRISGLRGLLEKKPSIDTLASSQVRWIRLLAIIMIEHRKTIEELYNLRVLGNRHPYHDRSGATIQRDVKYCISSCDDPRLTTAPLRNIVFALIFLPSTYVPLVERTSSI